MKNLFRSIPTVLALAIFLGVAAMGVASESMAAANPPSVDHGCGGPWGGRGPYGGHGCGW